MAITLNKVIGKTNSGKILYDRAGSPTNPIRRNDGSLVVTNVTPSNMKEIVRTEVLPNQNQVQISVKPAVQDTSGNTALDNLIKKNKAAEGTVSSPIAPLLVAAAVALVVLR